jgi:hypothetical protein
MAVVVLSMDLCVNRDCGNDEERKAEIQKGFKILEDARSHSSAADTFLESLMAVLRKHRVLFQQQEPSATSTADAMTKLCGQPSFSGGILNWPQPSVDNSVDTSSLQPDPTLDFGDVWQTYFDFGANFNPSDWDALFSDLNVRLD